MSEAKFGDRLKHAWNAFRSSTDSQNSIYVPSDIPIVDYGYSSTRRSDRVRLKPTTERNTVASLYNKIAIEVASVPIRHVKADQNGRYVKTIDSGLNRCLSVEANIDQTGRELIIDIVLSMFDEGVVAVVPIDTSFDLRKTNSFDILSLRTGRIVDWYPRYVRLEVYDDNDGVKKELVLPKEKVAIIENPFYSIMNEHNSTVTRLINKLNLLDSVDARNNSSKFNMILQFPYAIKTTAAQQKAKKRIEELEDQLVDSPHGIAYVDATEKIHQLNGSIESNLVQEIADLKKELYSQLGITEEVFNGTADERTMLNFRNSTIAPILSSITDEMVRKFLTKTAQTQGQTIQYIQDPFRLVPVDNIADIADKFTRNEIMSSNEIRAIVGMRPVDDKRADELRNKNLNQSSAAEAGEIEPVVTTDYGEY